MSPRKKILSLVVVLTLIMVALSSAFSGIASDPFLSRPLNNVPIVVPEPKPYLDVNWPDYGDEVLFRVTSSYGLSYLRTEVYTTYGGGSWASYTENLQSYHGGDAINVPEESSVNLVQRAMVVEPARAMALSLPIPKDASRVVPGEDLDLSYDLETQTMRMKGTTSDPYQVEFYLPEYDEAALRAAGVSPDDRYMGVPSSLSSQLAELADLIVQGVGSSYEKARAVEEFLESNYAYDREYSQSSGGTDPLEWFLFSSKEGVCTHFNSAFVLLVRSMGIPARLCSGYLLDPAVSTQDVVANMAHAYAEIKLDGAGWIIFDATPPIPEGSDDPPEGPLSSIFGQVYNDYNGNGVYDVGEAGQSGRLVVLASRSGGTVSVTQTGEGGSYSFSQVGSGDYSVQLSPRQGWLFTSPQSVDVTVDGLASIATAFFGVIPSGEPTGTDAPADPSDPSDPWPWELLAIPLLAIIVLAAVGATYYRKRPGPPPAAGSGAITRKTAPPSGPSPYAISFPQMADPLPDVWGAGDPLQVEVRGAGGSAAMSIDGQNARPIDLEDGTARFFLDLPAGEHTIGIEGDRGRSERKVRVVSYREEISRRYREALEAWKAAWPEVRDDLTPREVASVLVTKVGPERAEALEESAVLLELAEYSTHPMTRKELERMHQVLGEVKA